MGNHRCLQVTMLGVELIISAWLASAFGQEPFYKGKTVRIIVGGSAGGGYDAYTRAIARHLGKHIPGNPTFVVENMPGAGSIIAANYLYKVAKPDGLTLCHFIGGIILQQVLGKPGIEFDARKFLYLGVPAQDTSAVGVTKTSGVTSVEQWLSTKTSVKFGGIGPGTATDDLPKILRATLGLPIQLVTGYKGTADIRLAVNSGEMQGLVNAWESFKATWMREIETGAINVILVGIPQRHPEIPNVPSISEFVKTDDAKKLIQVACTIMVRRRGLMFFHLLPRKTASRYCGKDCLTRSKIQIFSPTRKERVSTSTRSVAKSSRKLLPELSL
ncbi:MAG TPA: tripartite tricarboxylate transporter substrate-binding protein [Candidatus Binatia bacterium]|nr:tripartite tricarboxylate transporter substrate-binding protein [Candidatus Binatia bacterium]